MYHTFPHQPHKREDLKKKLNVQSVFRIALQLLSETFITLGKNERDVIKYVN